jgi:hypothetical protein
MKTSTKIISGLAGIAVTSATLFGARAYQQHEAQYVTSTFENSATTSSNSTSPSAWRMGVKGQGEIKVKKDGSKIKIIPALQVTSTEGMAPDFDIANRFFDYDLNLVHMGGNSPKVKFDPEAGDLYGQFQSEANIRALDFYFIKEKLLDPTEFQMHPNKRQLTRIVMAKMQRRVASTLGLDESISVPLETYE